MSPSLNFRKLLTNARRLMPFLPPEPISPHMAKEQDASLLYIRLPPELRQMIWETYIRGHAVHIHRSGERLRARECLKWNVDEDAQRGPHFDVCGQANTLCNHISLLLTCKKIYFECIYTFYRETLFDFSHAPRCLTVMSERLPAAHISHISQVNLSWEMFHPLRLKSKDPGKREILWVDIWEALSAMEGLKWLRVELRLARPHLASEWTQLEWTLWEGIKKVTRPSHFELVLPFAADAATREETLPCTIVRRVTGR